MPTLRHSSRSCSGARSACLPPANRDSNLSRPSSKTSPRGLKPTLHQTVHTGGQAASATSERAGEQWNSRAGEKAKRKCRARFSARRKCRVGFSPRGENERGTRLPTRAASRAPRAGGLKAHPTLTLKSGVARITCNPGADRHKRGLGGVRKPHQRPRLTGALGRAGAVRDLKVAAPPLVRRWRTPIASNRGYPECKARFSARSGFCVGWTSAHA